MPKINEYSMLVSHSSLPGESSDRVKMTDCYGKSVGGVQWLRRRRKVEQVRDHVLDLLLLGAAIADH